MKAKVKRSFVDCFGVLRKKNEVVELSKEGFNDLFSCGLIEKVIVPKTEKNEEKPKTTKKTTNKKTK